jgi:type II secretory pathway pseudopilin PulG
MTALNNRDFPSANTEKQRVKGYLPSFTIVEMLVVLALSAIVFASGAFLYLNFNKYVNTAIQKNDAENSAILFYNAFKNDVQVADVIQTNPDEVTMNSAAKGKVLYLFNDDYIIREQEEVLDTFVFDVEDLVISVNPLTNRFNYFEARLINGDVVYPVFVAKDYPNGDLFNKEE